WVPPHYVWTPCGCVFCDGYWDYTLRDRGLLFAPVCWPRRPAVVVSWTYTPTYVVHHDCLYGCLFVRPGCRSYCFGDYFGPVYERSGYTAWVNITVGRGCYDPLFSYHAVQYRGDPWERDVRALYVGRARGTLAPPPRTLVQQTTVVNNITNVTNVTNVTQVNNVKNVTVLSPLNQANAQGVRLAPVAREERQREQKAAAELRQAAQARQKAETA